MAAAGWAQFAGAMVQLANGVTTSVLTDDATQSAIRHAKIAEHAGNVDAVRAYLPYATRATARLDPYAQGGTNALNMMSAFIFGNSQDLFREPLNIPVRPVRKDFKTGKEFRQAVKAWRTQYDDTVKRAADLGVEIKGRGEFKKPQAYGTEVSGKTGDYGINVQDTEWDPKARDEYIRKWNLEQNKVRQQQEGLRAAGIDTPEKLDAYLEQTGMIPPGGLARRYTYSQFAREAGLPEGSTLAQSLEPLMPDQFSAMLRSPTSAPVDRTGTPIYGTAPQKAGAPMGPTGARIASPDVPGRAPVSPAEGPPPGSYAGTGTMNTLNWMPSEAGAVNQPVGNGRWTGTAEDLAAARAGVKPEGMADWLPGHQGEVAKARRAIAEGTADFAGRTIPAGAPGPVAGAPPGIAQPGQSWLGWTLSDFTPQDLENSPGYQFGLQQGRAAREQSAVGRGALLSGATLKALEKYGQDYAGTKFNEAWARDQDLKSRNLKGYFDMANRAMTDRDRTLAAFQGMSGLNASESNRIFDYLNTLYGGGQRAATGQSGLDIGTGTTLADIIRGQGNTNAQYNMLSGLSRAQQWQGIGNAIDESVNTLTNMNWGSMGGGGMMGG